uniref:Salivary yellow-related protein n=1 Tax=Sergentomyia schwetzi TaxID=114605 RepID=A0A6B9VMY5_9DIPT|nr:salivary yellow-related protein [Sergentomyia schwetzi]
MKCLLCFVTILSVQQVFAENVNDALFSWRNLLHENNGNSEAGASIPTAVAHYPQEKKLFIAIPRMFKSDDVQHTLTEVEVKNDGNKSPKIKAFSGNVKDGLRSVYQPVIDECKRLWIVDDEKPTILTGYDLTQKNYPEIARYSFPGDSTNADQSYGQFAVDVINPQNGCDNTFVYIPSYSDNSLYVYDHKNKDSWTVTHSSFQPQKSTKSTDDGIAAIALGERSGDGHRPAYYIISSSTKLWKVNTKDLKQKKADVNPETIGDRGRKTQGITMTYDPKTKVLFIGQLNNNGIFCWNTEKKFEDSKDTILVNPRDKESVNIIDTSVDNDGTLWVLSYLHFAEDKPAAEDTPFFYISKVTTSKAIAGTRCQK